MAIIKTLTKTPKTDAPFRWLPRTGIRKPPQARAKAPVLVTSSRARVLKSLKLFKRRFNELRGSKSEQVSVSRPDLKALSEFKDDTRLGYSKSVGSIPGVEVGDEFEYRAELIIAGLHGKLQNGIDYTVFSKGRSSVATCVVAKQGFYDKMNDPDVIVYGGEGGGISRHKKVMVGDQVMKRGNLAMKNSVEAKNEVRVVREG